MSSSQSFLLDKVLEVGDFIYVGDLDYLDAAILLDVNIAQGRVDAVLWRVWLSRRVLTTLHLLGLSLRNSIPNILILKTLQELHNKFPI